MHRISPAARTWPRSGPDVRYPCLAMAQLVTQLNESAPALRDQDTLRAEFLRFYGAEDGGFAAVDLAREVREAPRQAVFGELAKLELRHLGQAAAPLDAAAVRASLAFVRERNNCADFTLAALLRILYRYGDTGLINPTLRQEIEETALTFKYWI